MLAPLLRIDFDVECDDLLFSLHRAARENMFVVKMNFKFYTRKPGIAFQPRHILFSRFEACAHLPVNPLVGNIDPGADIA
jgi:hypothetical protein